MSEKLCRVVEVIWKGGKRTEKVLKETWITANQARKEMTALERQHTSRIFALQLKELVEA